MSTNLPNQPNQPNQATVDKEQEELEKEREELEKRQAQLEKETVFKETKVLKQDQPQRQEQEFKYKKQAYDDYNKRVNELVTDIEGFNIKSEQKYERDLAKYQKELADYEAAKKKAESDYKKELAAWESNFKKQFGISYADYLKQEETRKKAEEAQKKELEQYQNTIKEIERQRDEALSKKHQKYWTEERNTGKSRSQFNLEMSRIAKGYNDKIENLQREKIKKDQMYAFTTSGYNYGILGGSWYRSWLKSDGSKSLISYYEDEIGRQQLQAERARQVSIKNAQSAAIKAAESYATNLGTYSQSIQKFEDKIAQAKAQDPFVMQKPTQKFVERLEKIKPTKPSAVAVAVSQRSGGLVQSMNRPLFTGVKFEIIEKPVAQQIIETKPTMRQMSAREISTAISLGMIPNQMIGELKDQNAAMQSMLSGEYTKQMPKQKESIRAMSARELSKEISEGKIPNQMIGNIKEPNAAMQSMLSGEYTKPIPSERVTEKPLSLTGSSVEQILQQIEKRQTQRPTTPLGHVLDWRFGVELGIAKESLSTYAFLENLYQKAKTINFRKEVPPPDSLSLKDLGKNFLARVQFEEPTRGEIKIPDTLFTTVSEPAFEKDFAVIPQKVKGYSEKYGIPSTVGEAGFILWGTGIEKGVESLAGGTKSLASKISQKVKPPLATVTPEGKIYPNIKQQRELYFTKLEASKPSQSITTELVKAKTQWQKPIDIKVKFTYDTPTPKTAVPVDWSIQETKIKLPSQSKPPIQKADLIGSVSRPTPKTGFAPITTPSIGTYKPPKIDVPKGVDVPKVVSSGKPPVSLDWSVQEIKVKMKPQSLPPVAKPDLIGSTFRITPKTGVSPLFTRIGTYKPIKQITKFDLLAEKANIKFVKSLTDIELKPLYKQNLYGKYEWKTFFRSEKITLSKELYLESKSPLSKLRMTQADEMTDIDKVLRHELMHKADPSIDEFAIRNLEADPIGLTKTLESGGRPRFIGTEKGIKFIPIKSVSKEDQKFIDSFIKELTGSKRATPISTDFTRWNIPAKTPKTGTAPITTPTMTSKLEGLNIIPSGKLQKGLPPIFEKIGTYKPPKIDVPKGIDVPKVVSSGKPPISIDWSVQEKAFRGTSKGRPLKELTYQSTFRPTPKTGSPPTLKAITPKIAKPIERDPLFVRFKGRDVIPKGMSPIEESRQYMAAKLKIQRTMPKGFGVSTSKPPISTDFTRWNIPAKTPKVGSPPIKQTPRYIIDEPPKLPKVGSPPSLQVWQPKSTAQAVKIDPLFVRFKGKVILPKGVTPSYFKETKIGLGETKVTTAPIMRLQKSPIKKKIEPKTPKKLAKELEKDIAKPDDTSIISKSGMVTIQKAEQITTPKQIQRTAIKSPTPQITLAKGKLPKVPKVGSSPMLFVPKYIEKKKYISEQSYKIQDYDQVTEYAVSNKIKTEPSLSYNVKPTQTPKTIIENKPALQSKSIITPITVYKPIQASKPVEITKQQQYERSIQKELVKQRQVQKMSFGQPPRLPPVQRLQAAPAQTPRLRQTAKIRFVPPNKNKIIRRAVLVTPDQDKKPKDKKRKTKKTMPFIGNVQLTRVEGMYKRKELTYGKRAKKLKKKDLEKEFVKQRRSSVKSFISKPSNINIITGKKQTKPKKSGNKLKRFLNF